MLLYATIKLTYWPIDIMNGMVKVFEAVINSRLKKIQRKARFLVKNKVGSGEETSFFFFFSFTGSC